MNIAKKIEEIREQPDNVRMRWVWGCVAVSMIIIFAVWIFSITAMLKKTSSEQETSSGLDDISQQLQNIKQQAPSLKDLNNQTSIIEEGVAGQQDAYSEYTPSGTAVSNIPESDTYSNLQNNQ